MHQLTDIKRVHGKAIRETVPGPTAKRLQAKTSITHVKANGYLTDEGKKKFWVTESIPLSDHVNHP